MKTTAPTVTYVLICLAVSFSSCNVRRVSSPEYQAHEKVRQQFIKRAKTFVSEEELGQIDETYFTGEGFHDWFRFPLVYPYEMQMIDDLNDGAITGGDAARVTGITHCAFDARVLVGKDGDGWLLFEFESGELGSFTSKEDVMAEAVKRGFDPELEILSVEEQFRRFANYR